MGGEIDRMLLVVEQRSSQERERPEAEDEREERNGWVHNQCYGCGHSSKVPELASNAWG